MNHPGVKRAGFRRGILEKVTEDSLLGGWPQTRASRASAPAGTRQQEEDAAGGKSLTAGLPSLNEQEAKSLAKKRKGCGRTDD